MRKKSIFFARTYRHLALSTATTVLFTCCLMVPSLVVFVLNIENITSFMSGMAAQVLGDAFPGIPLSIAQSEFSILGNIEFIDLPTVYPTATVVWINFLLMLAVLLFLGTGKRKGKPVSIYLMLGMIIHMVNCIYFIFAPNHFPYTAFEYSSLYMKQQIGIWLTFIVLTALVVGCVGNKGMLAKVLAFFGIMTYSFVFGVVRYIFFLYLLENFSVLYMALMFFVLGPFFDFLYLVAIYGFFMNRMVRLYDSTKGREEWKWS